MYKQSTCHNLGKLANQREVRKKTELRNSLPGRHHSNMNDFGKGRLLWIPDNSNLRRPEKSYTKIRLSRCPHKELRLSYMFLLYVCGMRQCEIYGLSYAVFTVWLRISRWPGTTNLYFEFDSIWIPDFLSKFPMLCLLQIALIPKTDTIKIFVDPVNERDKIEFERYRCRDYVMAPSKENIPEVCKKYYVSIAASIHERALGENCRNNFFRNFLIFLWKLTELKLFISQLFV